MKEFILVAQFAAIVWLATALIRVENERYALELGICPTVATAKQPSDYFDCVSSVETRTGPWWHLLYALRIL
jgi:hypothetical protein